MTVLVTGHQGYIGSVMVPLLLEGGHEVVGLDTGLYEACSFGNRRPDMAGVRLDIRNVEPRHLGGRYVRLAEIRRLPGQARLNDQVRWTGVNGG